MKITSCNCFDKEYGKGNYTVNRTCRRDLENELDNYPFFDGYDIECESDDDYRINCKYCCHCGKKIEVEE